MDLMQLLKDRLRGQAPKGAKRDPRWRQVRRIFLEENPGCAVCGKTKGVEVHHQIPFWAAKDLELNLANLITLCRRHHYFFGHCCDWKTFNPTVEEDAVYWRMKLQVDHE
jgi:hypothetical protein